MASESGFVRDTFEKVLRLKEILKFLNEDEFLREQHSTLVKRYFGLRVLDYVIIFIHYYH